MAWLHVIMVIQISFPLNPFLINIEQVDLKAADRVHICLSCHLVDTPGKRNRTTLTTGMASFKSYYKRDDNSD